MHPIHQTIQVTYQYTVHFTNHLFSADNTLLKDVVEGVAHLSYAQKVLCIVDRGVWQCHSDLHEAIVAYCQLHSAVLHLVRSPLVIDGGEDVKNEMQHVVLVQEALHRYGLCRHSYVLAIGGGALIDMVGYAAAIAHRGIRLIRVPTTVLAQCDAAVGVKNGINAFGKKNFLGTFAPPVAVLNDVHFLTTLAPRDWLSGLSEAIKVALLKDAAFFEFIEQSVEQLTTHDLPTMSQVIYHCARLHLDHIATSGDPFETGSSRPLDFGHWSAHKLEQLSGYTLRHGEAVAIGIALDATYSYLKGWLSQTDWRRILELMLALGFSIYVPELGQRLHDTSDSRCVLTGLIEFRQHLGGQLTISLLERIGKSIEVNVVDEVSVLESIALLAKYQATHQREG